MNWVRGRGGIGCGVMGAQVQRGKDRIHLDRGLVVRDGHTGSRALLSGK